MKACGLLVPLMAVTSICSPSTSMRIGISWASVVHLGPAVTLTLRVPSSASTPEASSLPSVLALVGAWLPMMILRSSM